MSGGWPVVRKQYTAALRAYVTRPDEAQLARAYELGRQLVAEESTILDLVAVYHRELAGLVRAAPTPHDANRAIALAQAFFSESLSPVAMAQRGFRDTIGRLRDLQQMLAFQQSIGVASRVSDVIERIITHAARPLGADTCMLLRPSVDGSWERVITGQGEGQTSAAPTTLDQELIARTSQTREPLVLGTVQADQGGDPSCQGVVGSLLAIALRNGERVLGVLTFQAAAADVFGPAEVALAQLVADYAAQALARAELLEEYTETQANERALRETNRRMEEFLSVAGHEFRTPLTSVLGNIQLAALWIAELTQADKERQERAAGNSSARLPQIGVLLQRMDRQSQVLNGLVNDLLDVSRIQAGRLELRPDLCDLAALVREIVEEYRQRFPQRSIHLDLPDEAAPVIADAERIGQVLTNYLANALKYSPPTGPITVALGVEAPAVRAVVRDHGPGVSVAEQEHLWERFYRVPGVRHQDGSSVGLGLGLYICQSIVERHGGQVGVESTPGAGATFWFTLPLAGAQVGANAEGDDAVQAHPGAE